jgi:hypothetical protein
MVGMREPLNAEAGAAQTVVNVQISGTFPGSPIALDYHFTIADGKITSLIIDS